MTGADLLEANQPSPIALAFRPGAAARAAVTFLAARRFVQAMGQTPGPYLPTPPALPGSPGIHVALAIGAVTWLRQAEAAVAARPAAGSGGFVPVAEGPRPAREGPPPVGAALREVLTGRTGAPLAGIPAHSWMARL